MVQRQREGNKKIQINEAKSPDLLAHYWATIIHKYYVATYLIRIAMHLIWRAIVHDLSKFTRSEKHYFATGARRLNKIKYGTKEYNIALQTIQNGVNAHYKKNRHHPEFHKNGINGMSIIDEIEMVCDWAAASKRYKDGSPVRSVMINKDRFKYGDERADIYFKIVRNIGGVK